MHLVFYEVKPWERRAIAKAFKGHRVKLLKETLNEDTVKYAKNADVISVFIYSKIDKRIISKLKRVKLIATRSTGFDHIDIKECRKRGIAVCNVPYYGENTVAEHTFALILALSRKVHKSYMRILKGDFSINGLMGFDLKGKTLGVIGAGHIGLHVIRIAKGFGMNVLAYDIKPNKFLAEVMGFEYTSFEDVLRKSDIITLHVPYTKATHHMINRKNIKLIKKGAILINTSRGPVVETDALIEALDKGILSGVGLDVVEGEEVIKEEKELLYKPEKIKKLATLGKLRLLVERENVVFTPHIAFYSKEALQRIINTTIENIKSFLEGNVKNSVY